MFKKGLLILAALLTTAAFTDDVSQELAPVAHFNKYANVQYNDVWGYTHADGREYALLGE